jgi:hypothetical protein
LSNIVEELGVELATAVFLRSLQDANVHGTFWRDVRGLELSTIDRAANRGIEVAVVASNMYLSARKWGDHVETWRAWARRLGFQTEVIETDPRRSIAANARMIFEYLARSPHRPRIIATYGQGSAEFRYLLQRRVNRETSHRPPNQMLSQLPEELAGVRGWINVCGAFSGAGSSRALQGHRLSRLLMRLRMKVAGRNPITLAETSSAFPIWHKPLVVPPRLCIASLIGVPYRWQVPVQLQLHYDALAKTTPSDGVVGVFEAAAYPGLIVPIAGMSHRAPATLLEPIFSRTLALMARDLDLDREPFGLRSIP